MEVKKIYMDLNEWVKKWNVWKLESEAFKKPIEIKIEYDNSEKQYFQRVKEDIQEEQNKVNQKLDEISAQLEKEKKITDAYSNMLDHYINTMDERADKMEKKDKEIDGLYKEIAGLKTTVEVLSGTTIKLQEQTSQISQKITKQPTIIRDKCFISWRESVGLWMIELNDGDYLLIAKYVIWEHNEYVNNKDEILMDKIHVEGQNYVPLYKLEWGTELDTPTATIYYDLVFMPI